MYTLSPLDQPSYCDLWMQYVMKRFSANYLSETSKYANIEMTAVAKMKLIYPLYPLTITNMGRTIMCISSLRFKWVGNHNQRRKRRRAI